MKKVFGKYFLILIPVLILQLLVIPFFRVQSSVPDLVTLLVIVFAIRFGQVNGMLFGFGTGLFFDLVSGGMIGSSMFAKTVAGFIAGFIHKPQETETQKNIFKVILIVFACSFFDSLFYTVFGSLELKLGLTNLLVYQAIIPGIYTTLVSIPFLLVMQKRDEL